MIRNMDRGAGPSSLIRGCRYSSPAAVSVLCSHEQDPIPGDPTQACRVMFRID